MFKMKKLLLPCLFFLFFSCFGAFAQNIYVKPNAGGDGSSWENAIDLADALELNELQSGYTIHIATGEYRPSHTITNGIEDDEKEFTFEISQNINLIGGYPANPSNTDVPSPSLNPTILSGLLESGVKVNHVITVSASLLSGESVVLSGLIIRDGNAASSGNSSINSIDFPKNYGAGIIMANARVELNECMIVNNQATLHGVGIYAFSNAEIIINNTDVANNTGATSNGCGLYLNAAKAVINNSSFENNITNGVGGAIQTFGSAVLRLYNTTIANNTAGSRAGAIYIRNNTQALIVNCTLFGNTTTTAPGNGGAIHTHDNSTVNIISSTITANTGGTGGGINNTAGCTVNIYNSIVSGNNENGTDSNLVGTVNYEFSVIGDTVFGEEGTPLADIVFDVASSLGTLSDNGGYAQTCALIGENNFAVGNGMSGEELQELISEFTAINTEDLSVLVSLDQTGSSREGTADLGAVIKPILVTGINVTVESDLPALISALNGTLQLIATVTPNNATNQNVTWALTSGNELAIISQEGMLTALADGTVTVTATSEDGDYSDSIEVIISGQTEVVEVTAMTVAVAGGAEPVINTEGDNLQLVATVTPQDATDMTIVWSVQSGNEVITIDENGLVTGMANGTAIVRATSQNGIYGEITIMVNTQTAGLEEYQENKVKFYPNPVDDVLYIDTPEQFNMVVIYNQLGSVIYSSKSSIVDLVHLEAGIYLLEVHFGDRVLRDKIIKK